MTVRKATIVSLDDWLACPAGRYFLAWEQAQFDAVVADLFGYHALQLGFPQLLGLRENRIMKQGVVLEQNPSSDTGARATHLAHFDHLPFASESVDLVALPHTLEFVASPYAVLSEVERVLRPEGYIVVSGFNPASLWGLRHRMGCWFGQHCLPKETQPRAYSLVKEQLRQLGLEIDGGRFGCYRLPSHTEKWLRYSTFMEKAGDRWWPIFGASYLLLAVKRVSGIRLIGPNWDRRHAAHRLTPAANSAPCGDHAACTDVSRY